MSLVRVTWVVVAVAVVGTPQAKAEEVLPKDHSVVKGETCAGLALRFYGDSRLVDLIHDANPGMGPSPHSLAAGRVLHIPANTAALTGPDARVGALRNRVEVQAPDPHPAKRQDPLFRGNKVSTREQSSAQVVFRDETELRLGEETLVIILGDAKRAASRLPAETSVVSGTARARLSELAGPTTLAGGDAKVSARGAEVQVAVDAKRTARVGVYRGRSKVSARGQAVEVPSNFGTKVVEGSAPSTPKPLPPAPTWKTPPPSRIATSSVATLEALYAAEKAARFHLEIASDADFVELLVDTKVPGSVLNVHAENLAPGDYFLRVSAFDEDGFESFYSDVARVLVVHEERQAVAPAPPPAAAAQRATPSAPPPSAPGKPPAHIQLALRGAHGTQDAASLLLGPALTLTIDQPVGPHTLALGFRAHYTFSPVDQSVCGTDGAGLVVCEDRGHREMGLALPLTLIPSMRGSWKPLFTLAPGISAAQHTTRNAQRETARSGSSDAELGLSVGMLSPWGLFFDAGYRQALRLSSRGDAPDPSGFVGHVGWRF